MKDYLDHLMISLPTIIVFIALVSIKCAGKHEMRPPAIKNYNAYDIYREEIDSCEYIIARGNNCISIIHKQNCKNHGKK